MGETKFTMSKQKGISLSGTSIKLGSNDVFIGNKADGKILVTTGVTGNDARASDCAWA